MMKSLKWMALVALLPATALAQNIASSKHNLSSSGTGAVKTTSTTEICIFCHTPHRAQSTQLLWNHKATAVTTFNWGTDLSGASLTQTTSGTPLPSTIMGPSKACLGCHDGTVALGDVSNAGGGVAGVIGGLANIAGETDAAGKLTNTAYLVGGASGNMGGNHPVSIPYQGSTTYNGATSSAAGYVAATGLLVGTLPLFPGAIAGSFGVECGSCHNPHGTANSYLLRVSNAASALCQTCHNK